MSIRNKLAGIALSAAGLLAIANYEGYRENAYRDSVGVPTIGFGTTEGVKMGDKTTPQRALALLYKDAGKTGEALKKCFGPETELTQGEWDAFVSLAYNVGSGAVCRSSIPKKLKAKQYEAACQTLLSFNKTCVTKNGKRVCTVNRGLDSRRKQEYQTCIK